MLEPVGVGRCRVNAKASMTGVWCLGVVFQSRSGVCIVLLEV
jgi:hypothetical protein